MKPASRPTQLALLSNLSNECRRAGEEGAVWRLADEAQHIWWVSDWRFIAMAHADVAVVLSKASAVQVGGNEDLVW